MMYALGMGGFDRPLPKMLKGIGWQMRDVPFFFKVARAFAFLRNIAPLRRTPLRRLAADALAFSGVGVIGIRAIQRRRRSNAEFEIVPSFSQWADDLWRRAEPEYSMTAVRDAETLNTLYPPESSRFIRVRVGDVGWAVVLDTRMQRHRYFGDMRVGTIADCFAASGDAEIVIGAATKLLESRGVDLIISNQSHDAWCAAMRATGFRQGPSNFIFATSKKLSALLDPFAESQGAIHVTRGDGDGPIHL